MIAIAGSVIGTTAGWFFGRRKTRADAVQSELENVEKAVGIWRQVADDLTLQMATLKSELADAKTEIEKLNREIQKLHAENADLRRMLSGTK